MLLMVAITGILILIVLYITIIAVLYDVSDD
jgi:hypothetical protein